MRPSSPVRAALPRSFPRTLRATLFCCACALLVLSGSFVSAWGQIISTVAGGFNPSNAASENFCQPFRAAAPRGTDIYIASCNRILKLDPQGNQTVIAGNGIAGFSGDGGPATGASFDFIRSLSIDGSGNIFVADAGNRIREVVALTGIIQTVAGTGARGFSGDGGPAISANLNDPFGVFVDRLGNIFIADTDNESIREVMAGTGIIQTVAGNGMFGSGGDGGPAINASLNRPEGVFVDAVGNIFIADTGNERIRKVSAGTGVIMPLAGNGTFGFSGDGGPATSAMLAQPNDVFGDASGNLFITDQANARIRKVIAGTAVIQTVAGNGAFSPVGCKTSLDACIGNGGPATSSTIGFPYAAFVDSSGNLFIDAFNDILKVAVGTASITTVAGNGAVGFGGDNGPATAAQFDYPADAVADSLGNIFIADMSAGTIREVVAATGIIKTVAGNGGTCTFPTTESCLGNGGPAINAVISPQAIAVDGSGNIFIADSYSEIREFTVGGNIQSVAGSVALAGGFSGDGGPATSAALGFPTDVFVDASDNIFIVDEFNSRVREVSGGIIRTVAGNGTLAFSGDGGPATSAAFDDPVSVFVDSSGNIFIADDVDHRIREVTAATGIIQTVAGNGISGFSGDGGPATSAEFGDGAPNSVGGDAHGNIFVADYFGNVIREFTVGGNIHTVVGNRIEGFSGDGGLAISAELNLPSSVSVDASARLLIGDSSNARVRIVDTLIAAFGPGPATMPTVVVGQSVQIPLTMFAASASNLTFTMACSNLPANSTCSFSPNPFAPGPPPNGSQVQLTFATQSPLSGALIGRREMPGLLRIFSIAAVLAFIGGISAWGKARRFQPTWATAIAVVALAAALTGCGGGNSSPGGLSGGTPKGVANITVTATAGATTLSKSIAINVQ